MRDELVGARRLPPAPGAIPIYAGAAAPDVGFGPGAGARRPWQRYLAEGLGTFALVFAGCGAAISNAMTGGGVSHTGVALTFGFVVATMIYALGPISAAHFNPAVTLGFAAVRRFPWRHVPAYLTAQSAGALLASLLHWLLFGPALAERAHYGATLPTLPLGAAAGFEGVLSFLLMLVIMAVATDRRVTAAVPGLAIGLTVAACALFAGPVTGASMNPARSLAPALLAGGAALTVLPLYLLAPPAGAILAACCYELLRDGTLHAQSAPPGLEEARPGDIGLAHATGDP
jgi:MIP family channel proteins